MIPPTVHFIQPSQQITNKGDYTMGFKEAIITVLNNYANFSGRARRSEYWYFVLFTSIVTGVLSILGGNPENGRNIFTILSSLFSIAIFIPNLAVIWRRLHDIGKSGLNYFWILLPLIGWIMLLVWLARDSMPGENLYGPNPKETYYYTE